MKRLLHSSVADRIMRGAALVVTDRRWAATLSAAALGFGLFVGVAIGPGAAGTFATGAPQIVQVPESSGGEEEAVVAEGAGSALSSEEPAVPLSKGGGGGFAEALPSSVPLAPEVIEPVPAAPESTPKPTPAGSEEEPEETEGQTFEGTVVHANQAAGSYALAIKGGELVAVHAAKLPDPGSKLSVPLTRLENGAFAEADPPEEGKKATKATFRGAVTFVNPDPASPAYTVSGRGASLLVRVHPDPAGTVPELPALGSYVTVNATIDPEAVLWQGKVEVEPGPPSTYLDLSGIVTEVLPDTAQLLFSADDARESGKDLTLTIPAGIDATKLKSGDSYLATATVEPDGSLTLSGIASDEHKKGAEDSSSAQGDLKR